MKPYTKIVLLVAIALFLTLTACTRQASKPPVSATATGEAPFPFTTAGGVEAFGTQTAIAATPGAGGAGGVATNTPEVVVSTATAAAGQGGSTESGGGQTSPNQGSTAPTATSAAAVVNTPAVTRPTTYSLQKGEWPICIARRYNLDIPSFFAANGLNMNSKPAAGTSLKIPASGSWNASYGARALKSHPTNYTVVAGDTVYTIACRYGDVTPEAILAVNGLASAGDLKSGTSIKIP